MRLPGTVSRCERRGCGMSGRYIVVVRQMASALPFCLLLPLLNSVSRGGDVRDTLNVADPLTADISHDLIR